MKNSLTDLRNHLFEVIERLKDPQQNAGMDVDVAQAICLAADKLLDSARVEIEYRKLVQTESDSTDFLKLPSAKK